MTLREAVNEIHAKVDPVRAIEIYTGQRPQQRKYLCPFHPDRHPSLTIKGDHWRCWSCGAHGDVIDFVRMYYGIDFKAAVEKIATDNGLVLPVWGGATRGRPPDPREDFFDQVRREADQWNREQIRLCRCEVEDRIEQLSSAHRILMQHGGPASLLEELGEEIDKLMLEL